MRAFQWYQDFGEGHHGLENLNTTNKQKKNLSK
jgi:hypothetical protein